MNVRAFAIEQFGAALRQLLKNPGVDFVQMDASTHFPHFKASVDPVTPQLMCVQLGIAISGIPVFGTCVVNIADATHRLREITVFFPQISPIAPHRHPFRDDAIPGTHTFVAKPVSWCEFVLIPRPEPSRSVIPKP